MEMIQYLDHSAGPNDLFVRVCSNRSRVELRQLAFFPPLRHHLMADYDFRPGGSLKLKGGVADGGIVKKYVSLAGPHADNVSDHQEEEIKGEIET